MLDLQAQELFDDEEQEEANRTRRVQKILSVVQQAYSPQGDEVVRPTPARRTISARAGAGLEADRSRRQSSTLLPKKENQ